MTRERVRPVRVKGGMYDDYAEQHPAYAMIGASRTQSNGASLTGSDFLHRSYITVRIAEAQLFRAHSSDRWHAGRQLVEVALSEAQWATFLSTLNMGDGVPATLQRRESGEVAGIEPITERREQHRGEVNDTLRDALTFLDELSVDIEAGRGKTILREKVRRAKQELEDNLPFVAQRFDEHAETTVERAKIEVEAYLTGAVHRAGLAALGGQVPPIQLAEGNGETDSGL